MSSHEISSIQSLPIITPEFSAARPMNLLLYSYTMGEGEPNGICIQVGERTSNPDKCTTTLSDFFDIALGEVKLSTQYVRDPRDSP